MNRIRFSHEAFKIMTDAQKRTIASLAGESNDLEVIAKDFSLPDGWLSFVLRYSESSQAIYGGISPEGDAHT